MMTRRFFVHCVAVLIVAAWMAPVAGAQTAETVLYYHFDAIGSVRAITDQAGQVVERHDYWPFGVVADAAAPVGPARFAGGERDPETQLIHFGFRYADASSGRFMSPDPIAADPLRQVNPQRWNRYAYAVNNPLRYVDPDGLDALFVNFVDGAFGVGHVGIMALHSNGAGLYGGFAPARGGRPYDFYGRVRDFEIPAGFVTFGPDGALTEASTAKLAAALAAVDGKNPRTVRIRQIKTSATETSALESYIRRRTRSPLPYGLVLNDCLDFCVRGLWSAGVPAPLPSMITGGVAPNVYFESWLLEVASRFSEWLDRPVAKVETSYCVRGIDC